MITFLPFGDTLLCCLDAQSIRAFTLEPFTSSDRHLEHDIVISLHASKLSYYQSRRIHKAEESRAWPRDQRCCFPVERPTSSASRYAAPHRVRCWRKAPCTKAVADQSESASTSFPRQSHFWENKTYNIVNETNGDTCRPDTCVNIARFVDRLATCARNELSNLFELGSFGTIFQSHDFHRDFVPVLRSVKRR